MRVLSIALQLSVQLEYYNIIVGIVGSYLANLFLLLNMIIVFSLTPEILFGAISIDSAIFREVVNMMNQGIISFSLESIWIVVTMWLITIKVQALSLII